MLLAVVGVGGTGDRPCWQHNGASQVNLGTSLFRSPRVVLRFPGQPTRVREPWQGAAGAEETQGSQRSRGQMLVASPS